MRKAELYIRLRADKKLVPVWKRLGGTGWLLQLITAVADGSVPDPLPYRRPYGGKVLAALPGDYETVMKATGLCRSSAKSILSRLAARGDVHVVQHKLTGGKPRFVYAVGPGDGSKPEVVDERDPPVREAVDQPLPSTHLNALFGRYEP